MTPDLNHAPGSQAKTTAGREMGVRQTRAASSGVKTSGLRRAAPNNCHSHQPISAAMSNSAPRAAGATGDSMSSPWAAAEVTRASTANPQTPKKSTR